MIRIRKEIEEGKVEPRIVELAKKLEDKLRDGATDYVIEDYVIHLIGAVLVATEDVFPTIDQLAESYKSWAKEEGERLLKEKQRKAYLKKKEEKRKEEDRK
jgi:hypothetical protein